MNHTIFLTSRKDQTKHVALQTLPIYYTWKNIRQQCKNNKQAIHVDDEFQLPDGSYSVCDIQDYIEYIIKNIKHYTLILLFVFTSTRLITSV